MMAIPPDLARLYESLLARKGVAVKERPYFHKWLRYDLDFCQKYSLAPADRGSVPAFDEKLRSKNQSEAQRQQARQAVAVYFEALASGRAPGSCPPTRAPAPVGTDVGPARNSSRDASRFSPSSAPRPSTPLNRPTPTAAPSHAESPTPRDGHVFRKHPARQFCPPDRLAKAN